MEVLLVGFDEVCCSVLVAAVVTGGCCAYVTGGEGAGYDVAGGAVAVLLSVTGALVASGGYWAGAGGLGLGADVTGAFLTLARTASSFCY